MIAPYSARLFISLAIGERSLAGRPAHPVRGGTGAGTSGRDNPTARGWQFEFFLLCFASAFPCRAN